MAAILLALAPGWGLIDAMHNYANKRQERKLTRRESKKLRKQLAAEERQRLARPRTRQYLLFFEYLGEFSLHADDGSLFA